MGRELRIRLRGSVAELDVQRVLSDLTSLVTLLGLLEDAQLRKDRRPASRSTWAFSALRLGSVDVAIAPLEPRGGSSYEVLDRVPELFVVGFEEVESSPRFPAGWDSRAVGIAERAASNLGADANRGMVLTLLVDGQERRNAEITHRASTNAKAAVRTSYQSLGSVIGTLDSVSVHRSKRRAGLWTDRGDRRVEVRFGTEQLDEIKALLGRRVEVWGRLSRNAGDEVLSVQVRRFIEIRQSGEGHRLAELRGIAPNLTDGQNVAEYLGRLRGTS